MPLKPGSYVSFSNSMAAAMESAFQTYWQSVKGTPLPDAGLEDRKILFIAIARGVVQHLREQVPSSFVLDVDISGAGSGSVTEVITDET